MEPSENTLEGSVRVCGVATFKSGGAVAKLLPELKKVFEVTAEKEEGFLGGRPYIEEGKTEETATKLFTMTLWKNQAAFDAHRETPHVKAFREILLSFEPEFKLVVLKSLF